jgi:hypothetical protein
MDVRGYSIKCPDIYQIGKGIYIRIKQNHLTVRVKNEIYSTAFLTIQFGIFEVEF